MSDQAISDGISRMTLLAGLICGLVGFAYSQAAAGGGAPRAADAGVASGGAAIGGTIVGGRAAGVGAAAGAAAGEQSRGGNEGGGMPSGMPGLGGAASEPGGAVLRVKRDRPVWQVPMHPGDLRDRKIHQCFQAGEEDIEEALNKSSLSALLVKSG